MIVDDDRLDLLILARIGRAAKKAPGASDVRKALAPLLEHALGPGELRQRVEARIASLRERGLVEPRRLAMTEAGADHLRQALGVERAPTWEQVKKKIAPALALGVEPGDRALASGEALIATVLARRLGIEDVGATINAVIDAAVSDRLGLPRGKLDLKRIRAHVLAQLGAGAGKEPDQLARRLAAASVRAPKPGADAVRDALVRRWLAGSADGEAPAPPPRADVALPAFATAVRAAAVTAARADSGRLGHKVFISAVWRHLHGDPRFAAMPIDRFKQLLVDANREGLLTLTRADLVTAMDPGEVAASEIRHLGATFHFVTGD